MKGVVRPKAVVLGEETLVPPECLVTPPERFTHRLTRAQPFWFDRASDARPSGELPAGTEVQLTRHDGTWCRVVDRRGLRVETAAEGLAPL